MPPISKKQWAGIAVIVLFAAYSAFNTPSQAAISALAALALVSSLAVVFTSGSAAALPAGLFDDLVASARKAKGGRRPEVPASAIAEAVPVYRELAALATRVEELEAAAAEGGSSEELDRMTARVAELEASEAKRRERTGNAVASVSDAVRRLTDGIAQQLELGETAAKHVRETSQALKEISQHVEMLAASAEESSSSIL
jgi:pyridoxal biosynthesis lyase PdxS